MASTEFLDLTNRLLRRLNEVTIDQADFASVRGVQAMAKDVINASIQEINSQQFEWPFNATMGSQVLTVDVEEYAFPATLKVVRWDTFAISKDDALNTSGGPLRFISRDVRNQYMKNLDDNSTPDGLREPEYVFPKHGFGFGVTPSPDQAYTVTFEYFAEQPELTAYDDTPTIPSSYDETIIQGALHHFYMFRDNSAQAAIAEKKFERMVGYMRTLLVNTEDQFRSTMITHRTPFGSVSPLGALIE